METLNYFTFACSSWINCHCCHHHHHCCCSHRLIFLTVFLDPPHRITIRSVKICVVVPSQVIITMHKSDILRFCFNNGKKKRAWGDKPFIFFLSVCLSLEDILFELLSAKATVLILLYFRVHYNNASSYICQTLTSWVLLNFGALFILEQHIYEKIIYIYRSIRFIWM